MSDIDAGEDVGARLDRLESLVERQAEFVEAQRETIEAQAERLDRVESHLRTLVEGAAEDAPDHVEGDGAADESEEDENTLLTRRNALTAAAAVGLFGAGSGTASAEPTGRVGKPGRPVRNVYTQRLAGGLTDGWSVNDLLGPGLTTETGDRGGDVALSADPAASDHVDVAGDSGFEVEDVERFELAGALSGAELEAGVVELDADDDAIQPEITDDGSTVDGFVQTIDFGSNLDVTGGDGSVSIAADVQQATNWTEADSDDLLEPVSPYTGIDVADVRTDSLNGGVTGNGDLTSLLGNGLVLSSGALGIATGGVGTGELATPFAALATLFGSPVAAGASLALGGNDLTNVGEVTATTASVGTLDNDGSPIALGDKLDANKNTIKDAKQVLGPGYVDKMTVEAGNGSNLVLSAPQDISLRPNTDSGSPGCCVRVENNNGDTILEARDNGEVKTPGLDSGGGDAARPVAVESSDGELVRDVDIDLDGNDLVDGSTTIWDTSNSYVPQGRLEYDSVTVTAGDGLKNGGNVSLGKSTTLDVEPADFAGSLLSDDGSDNLQVDESSISHDNIDQATVDSSDHHTRPAAGDGLTDDSNTFNIEPTDFAGNALEDDGSDNLAVSTGGVGTGELNTPFSDLNSLFGSPVSAGANIDMGTSNLTSTSDDLFLEGSPDVQLINSSFNVNGNTIYDSGGYVTIDDYLTVKNFESNTGTNLVVDSNGDISKDSSSLRYKTDIEPLDWPTAPVLDLGPRSFEFEETGVSDFGLIAEEVEEILPELVVYDDQDRPESVKYRRLGVLLIPEVAENRDGLRDLEDETDDLETRIADLGADADAKEARIDNQQDRIETLESTVERKQDRIDALERENERLRDRLDRVEAHLGIDDQDDAARQGVANN